MKSVCGPRLDIETVASGGKVKLEISYIFGPMSLSKQNWPEPYRVIFETHPSFLFDGNEWFAQNMTCFVVGKPEDASEEVRKRAGVPLTS